MTRVIVDLCPGPFWTCSVFFQPPPCAQYCHTPFRIFSLIGIFSGVVSKWTRVIVDLCPGPFWTCSGDFRSSPSVHDSSQAESEPRRNSRPFFGEFASQLRPDSSTFSGHYVLEGGQYLHERTQTKKVKMFGKRC